MRDTVLELYRMLTFTPTEQRDIAFMDEIIDITEHCPASPDIAANYVMGAALAEFRRVREFMLDNREFPELLELLPWDGAAEIVASFVQTERDFVIGGIWFVTREFIYPVVKWHYSLVPQVTELSFHQFLLEHDPELIEVLEPLRVMNIRLLLP